jgi:hypothetical protein
MSPFLRPESRLLRAEPEFGPGFVTFSGLSCVDLAMCNDAVAAQHQNEHLSAAQGLTEDHKPVSFL